MMGSPAPDPLQPEERYPTERYEARPEFRVVPRTMRDIADEGDVVRWGPVLGGMVSAMGIMLVLTVLGVAVGLADIGPGGIAAIDPTNWGIWAAASMIISLFVGGWLAARTSVFGGAFPGIVNASIVWASFLFVTLFLAGVGISAASGPLGGLFPTDLTPGATPLPDAAASSALWAFIGLVISFGAAVAGGYWGGLWHTTHAEQAPRPQR